MKYVERFGPGAILWTKCGFCDAVAEDLDEVAHFRPNKTVGTTLKKSKNKKKKKKGDEPQIKKRPGVMGPAGGGMRSRHKYMYEAGDSTSVELPTITDGFIAVAKTGAGKTFGFLQPSKTVDKTDPGQAAAQAAAARAERSTCLVEQGGVSPSTVVASSQRAPTIVAQNPKSSPAKTTKKTYAKRTTLRPLRPWNAPPIDCIDQPRYKPAAPSEATQPAPPQSAVRVHLEVHSSLTDEWRPVAARVNFKYNSDGYTTVSRSLADSLDLLDVDGFPKFIARMTVARDSEFRVIVPKVQLRVCGKTWTTDLAMDDTEEELVIGQRDARFVGIVNHVQTTTASEILACDEGVPPSS